MLERPPDRNYTIEKQASDTVPWSLQQTLLGIALTLLPWLLLAVTLNTLGGNTTSGNTHLTFQADLMAAIITLVFSAIIEGAFLIAPFYFANRAFRGLRNHMRLAWNSLGFRRVSSRYTAGIIIGLLLAIFAVDFLYSYVITALHLNLQTNDQVILAHSKQAPLTTYATLLAAVFIAPFCEEIFFRGFVFPGLCKGMPVGGAILLSALLFGVAHADVGSFAVLFVIGLALAFVRWHTKSIWPGMLLHMLNNGIGALSIILAMQGTIH